MRRGFTLIELAVVVGILIILLGGAVFYYARFHQKGIADALHTFFWVQTQRIDYYKQDTGRYPADFKQLWDNTDGVAGWSGPYEKPPHLDNTLDYVKSPLGKAYLECSAGEYVRIAIPNAPESVCSELDKSRDDGNLSSGRVRYQSGTCYYYIDTGSAVSCSR